MAVQDIIVSPAKLYYAPVGTAVPDETTVGAGTEWPAAWKDLGFTLEPANVSMTVEEFSLMVEQSILPVRKLRTASNVQIATVLAEMTGDILALVLDATKVTTAAGAAQTGYDDITLNAGKTDISLYAFGLEGVRVTDANARLPVRFFIPRGTVTTNGDISFSKSAGAGIPVMISALADTGGTGLKIHNVTAPATA